MKQRSAVLFITTLLTTILQGSSLASEILKNLYLAGRIPEDRFFILCGLLALILLAVFGVWVNVNRRSQLPYLALFSLFLGLILGLRLF